MFYQSGCPHSIIQVNHSESVQTGTFPVHWMGIPHLWAICSRVSHFFVEIFTLWARLLKDSKSLWKDGIILSRRNEPDFPVVVVAVAGGSVLVVFFLFLITS